MPTNTPAESARLEAFHRYGVAFILAFATAVAGQADDRDLFRASASDPYVFFLFDTSGSMHWRQDNGFALTSADDPASKLYQAKSALYTVLRRLDPETRLGWAHFAQEDLRVERKHWAYSPKAGQSTPPWFSQLPYPVVGEAEHFGRPGAREGNNRYTLGACDAVTNADDGQTELVVGLDNARFFPKLGDDGSKVSVLWLRHDGNDYALRWSLADGSVWGASQIDVEIEFWRESGCDYSGYKKATLTYEAAVRRDADGVEIRDALGPLTSDFIARTEGHLIPGNRTFSLNDMFSANPCDTDPKWYPNNNDATGSVDASDASALAYPVFDVDAGRYGQAATCSVQDGALARGSMIPWDWVRHPSVSTPLPGFELNTRDELMCRLAPNTCSTDPANYHVVSADDVAAGLYTEYEVGDRVPDFRVARYFEDDIVDGRLKLKEGFERYKPLAAYSATPLAGMMRELEQWLEHWEPCAQDPAVGDRDYVCRERYAIVLTDGAETCETNESGGRNTALKSAAEKLRAAGVRTFVVGFGSGVDAAQLEDIADFGGTGVLDLPVGDESSGDGERDCTLQFPGDQSCRGPILAQDKDSLVLALNNLLSSISSEQASFASAAVPAGQTDAQDSIFLTNFVPLEETSRWSGEMLHFIRPLPLRQSGSGDDVRNVPDETKRCGPNRKSSCLAWKANESMLGIGSGTVRQVPPVDLKETPPTVVDAQVLKLGNQPGQRRVHFGLGLERYSSAVGYSPDLLRVHDDGIARATLLLDTGILTLPKLLTSSQTDYSSLLERANRALDSSAELARRVQRNLERVLIDTYVERVAENPLDDGDSELNYILGDVFHSDPQQLGDPTNAAYMQGNLPAGATDDCDDLTSTSYKCFFTRHQYRRKVVFVGANDAQLHAFDAGMFDSQVKQDRQVGAFDLGTGQELFSFIPNALLGRVRQMTQSAQHEYGVDGELRIGDVFIDPKHDGQPTPSHRQWRTVLMAGFREGGNTVERLGGLSSYFALDVTQPDRLIKSPDRSVANGGAWVPAADSYVPSCLSNYQESACGPLPYGSVLWEFSDLDPLTGLPADEDLTGPGVGKSDLGPTWSRPTIGRVGVVDASGVKEDRFVAVFGGGYDADDPGRGNWLYVLDLETGKPLAKRQLVGAAPSAPAAVDTDGDAYLDTVYIGTVAGNLYKVDLSDRGVLRNDGRVRDADWTPLRVFEAGPQYPMFTPPSVIFVPREDRYAVSFGVGNRADLWDQSSSNVPGRFYTLLDTGWKQEPGFEALTETDYESFRADDTVDRGNLLSDPPAGKEPGWIMRLTNGEKLIGRPFTIAGVTVFSTYNPEPLRFLGGTTGVTCQRDGGTNIYTVFSTNANALTRTRSRTVPGIVSNPFTEVSALQGRGGFGQEGEDEGGSDSENQVGPTAEDLDDDLRSLRDSIADLFPDDCRFNNVTVNLKVVRSDTGIEFIAPVPVCVQPTNWKRWP